MSRKNRYYPPEFKQEALELLAAGEYSMAKLETKLGITPGLLRQWRRKAAYKGENASSKGEPKTAAEAEERIRQLKRENARLRQEREILKKAMAIFSSPKE
jgi:transposase